MVKCKRCGYEFHEDVEILRKNNQLKIYKDFEDGSIELHHCGKCHPVTEKEKKLGVEGLVKKLFRLDQGEKNGQVEVTFTDAKDLPN